MTSVHDALGELLRTQVLKVHYLPGLPAAHYTVRAPCLLAQLADAIGVGTERAGGRGADGSRALVSAEALDLWTGITTAAHTWAQTLGVDRRPYLQPPAAQRPAAERTPDWMRRLEPYVAPVDWSAPPPDPAELERLKAAFLRAAGGPAMLLPVDLQLVPLDGDRPDDRTVPPLGRLLRAVAAAADVQRADDILDRLTRNALRWAAQIRTLLTPTTDIRALRGLVCSACGETSIVEQRDDGADYRVPALVVRLAAMEGGDPDDRWPYLECRACGDAGWLEYTGEHRPAGTDDPTEEAA